MPASETTVLLHAASDGDADAAERLLPLVYDELRRISQSYLDAEPGVVTVSATGLVHEAYLRLIGSGDWADRVHFVAVASRAMRRILVSRARARNAQKRGGGRPVTLVVEPADGAPDVSDVLAIDDALERLAARDSDLARVVELRFFGGLGTAEIAHATGVSERTAARQWVRARAYLRADLNADAHVS